ncbi:MFS transporter [Salinigranum marinum]|uniref:MFS transporter n=1 Tax=Salinigranum marinum TaxID=1515595 RepID=UPI002989EF8F|nr:MFS transporter [Salinigranum marinum]
MATATVRRRSLWVLVAAATLTVMAGAILGPIVPQIRDELGVSGAAAGLIITTHGGVIVLASPLMGVLVDRLGPRRPFVGGLAVYGLGGGAGLVVDSFLPLLASRAVLGLGTAAVYTAVTVLIYDLYEGREMERALGYRSSANSAGAAVWPLVGGTAGTVAWNLPFGVYLVALPLGLVAAATIPETHTDRGTDADAVADGARAPGLRDRLAATLAVFRRRPALLAVYLLYFGANALLYVVVVFYPQFLPGVGVSSSFAISLYLAANGVAGGVAAAGYDRLVRRVDRSTLVFAALCLWAVGFGAATVAASAVASVLPVVLAGLGVGLVFPSTFAWVEAFAPPDRQGQFSSYVASFGYTGQFLSPLLFGPLVPVVGLRGVFGAAAVVAAAAAVGLGVARLRGSERDHA